MSHRVLIGDCLTTLPTLDAGSVQCCVTSPPYFGLRDYGAAGQIGLEPTPDEYVARLVAVFREVRRVLADDGTLWLNLGDSYAGSWGNHGRKEGGGSQRAKTRPAIQTFGKSAIHAIDCDLGDDCTCGAADALKYPDRQTRTGAIPDGAGYKAKDLLGIPWMVAFALRADGWYLRADIVWAKPNPMPESVTDRPTKAHEYVFLLSKSARYFYDADAIREPLAPASVERLGQPSLGTQAGSARANGGAKTNGPMKAVPPRRSGNVERTYGAERGRPDSHLGGNVPWEDDGTGRNARSVWTIATQPYSGAHFATMPPALAERCIKAGSRRGDTVLDPFGGAGTTGLVADRLGRDAVLCELNPAYAALAEERIRADAPLFADGAA